MPAPYSLCYRRFTVLPVSPLTATLARMTAYDPRYALLLDDLDEDERARLEITVEEILEEVDRTDADRIDAAADVFQDRAQIHPDIEAAAVALLIVASLREHALKTRHGLN